MNLFKSSMIALAVMGATNVFAETIAVTDTTVYTGTKQGVLTNTTVIIEEGVIKAFNPSQLNVDRTIDGQDKVLTAGLISAMNNIGLVEVGAVASSRDASAKKGGITFDPSLAFNAESTLIPFARKGGITHSIVVPRGGDDIFSGQAFSVLMNSEFDSVIDTQVAVIAEFGGDSDDSRASSLAMLIDTLEEHQKKTSKKSDDDKEKEPTAKDKVLSSLLDGSKPLVAGASRASDILELLKIKERFGLNLVIRYAHSAVKVKQQLADAKVPVIIQVMDNLPGDFDSLHASLTTAGELEQAGVKVLLMNGDSHLVKNLRLDAGNAVSYGMSKDGAIAAMTTNIAEVFGLDAGTIEQGGKANLVLWSGDPLEISTRVENVWIDGEEVSTESRQDKLRDRYTSDENKRRGYIK
jgi:imidazolonepropionase-like amidohydrolase